MQANAGGEVAEVVIFSVLPDTCAPPEDAHDAYVKAANELFGEFASAPPETDILAVLSDAYAQPTVLASIMPVGKLAMAKKKTPEEIAEENTRTNEVGLFNFANSYLLCAKELLKKRPPPPRPAPWRFDDPIHFLLFHAAELYLKSYLRQKGEDVAALKDLGHYHARICEKAATFGLNLSFEIQRYLRAFRSERCCHREPIHCNRLDENA